MASTSLLKRRSVSYQNTLRGGVGLSVVFFIFYLLIGSHYLSIERSRGEGYHDNDLYFQADSEFLVLKLFSTRGYYKRAMFHPLFPIMFNPSAHVVQKVIANPYLVASLYCALFGAVCILGSVYLFYHLSIPWPRSLLYASFVGLSSSHLVFSTIPDTYIFSMAGLIALMIVVVRKAPLWCWALVSVYLVGVNIVNVLFVGIAVLYAIFIEKDRWLPKVEDWKNTMKRKRLIRYLSQAGVLFAGLVLLQKLVLNFWLLANPRKPFQDTQFFFVPENITQMTERFVSLAEHILYFNIVAPTAKMVPHLRNPEFQLVSFRDTSGMDYPAFAWPGVFIWTGILIVAAWSVYHYQLYRLPVVKIALLCLLANTVFFYLYGDDMMLYSGEWTFFLLLLVFLGLEKVIRKKRITQASLLFVLFLAMVLLNNLYFQWQMFSFHQF